MALEAQLREDIVQGARRRLFTNPLRTLAAITIFR
jgi:hypothetical protein